jgi:hypothetical protein
MTRRLVFGLILAAAVATPAVWPFKKSKESKPASSSATEKAKAEQKQGFDSLYASGTIAAIPQLINGKLDLSDKSTLKFHYGKPTWSLAYSKVTGIEVGDKKQARLVKVPKLMKDKRIFTINFENDKGQKHNMVLELNVEEALTALPLLEERTGKAAVVAGAMNPDGWWGDRYWRTAHNAQVWDEAKGNKPSVAVNQ